MKILNSGGRLPIGSAMEERRAVTRTVGGSTCNAEPAAPSYCGGSRSPRGGNERGSAIAEFALVAAMLFLIIFALIEGGLVVRARNSIASAADEAARRGSIAASEPSADWQILQQLRVRGALRNADVNYVVVYRAASSSDEPTEACRAGTPVTDECNVYDRVDFEAPSDVFDCSDGALDANWCPSERTPDAGIDYIGVYVDADHRGLTGVFGDIELNAVSVLPFEEGAGL